MTVAFEGANIQQVDENTISEPLEVCFGAPSGAISSPIVVRITTQPGSAVGMFACIHASQVNPIVCKRCMCMYVCDNVVLIRTLLVIRWTILPILLFRPMISSFSFHHLA